LVRNKGYLLTGPKSMGFFLKEYNEKDIMPAYLEQEEKEYFNAFIASEPNQYKK
jgi:hypothetical protein